MFLFPFVNNIHTKVSAPWHTRKPIIDPIPMVGQVPMLDPIPMVDPNPWWTPYP